MTHPDSVPEILSNGSNWFHFDASPNRDRLPNLPYVLTPISLLRLLQKWS